MTARFKIDTDGQTYRVIDTARREPIVSGLDFSAAVTLCKTRNQVVR